MGLARIQPPESLQSGGESRENEILKKNEKLIDDTMSKLGYKLQRIDGKAGRIYESKDDSNNTLSIYGGISGVPKNKDLDQSSIIGALLDQNNGIRNSEATQQINNLLGTHIPEEFDRFDIENLTQLIPYIKNYKSIPYEEYKEVKSMLSHLIKKQTGIRIDNDFSLDGNITQIGNGLILMIDGKWVNRDDENFGKVESINVNLTKNIVEILEK